MIALEIEDESEILLSLRKKELIDWDTTDRLIDENKDFKQFVVILSLLQNVEKLA